MKRLTITFTRTDCTPTDFSSFGADFRASIRAIAARAEVGITHSSVSGASGSIVLDLITLPLLVPTLDRLSELITTAFPGAIISHTYDNSQEVK